ncbi:hypothetical protein M9Y10_010733 [Tritrichomonas musculus]|uniref:Uncharacterized protein n=1 Tax=Tritrichomonas musculus TaxID=1915356 RepID=A0ABR2ILQ8_9EUKA
MAQFGVLFDNDGVILDTETQYKIFWNEQGKIFHPELTNFHGYLLGISLTEALDTYFSDNQQDRETIVKRLYEFEDKMIYDYFPGALELLQSLKEKKIPTALVTSSNDIKMNKILKSRPEFKELFTDIITANRVPKTKPNPECYEEGARAIKMDTRRCIVFEDSVAGIKAGKAAGCFVVGLTTTKPKEVIEKVADLVIEDLSKMSYEYIEQVILPKLPK